MHAPCADRGVCVDVAGMKLGVVSNFDTRLRPLLDGMGISGVFDTLIISAEVYFPPCCGHQTLWVLHPDHYMIAW